MIRFRSTGGLETHIMPVFVCDICGEAITNIKDGAVVFRYRGVGEGELLELLHVHKEACHEQAEVRLVGESGARWHELADHLNEIAIGLGVTIDGMVLRELAWRDALNPSEVAELRQRIHELGEWLRAHGLDSPLWD